MTLRARWAGTTSTDRPPGLGIYRTHPYHVPGGAVPVWEPMLGLLGTAPNPNRVEHDQGGKRVNTLLYATHDRTAVPVKDVLCDGLNYLASTKAHRSRVVLKQ